MFYLNSMKKNDIVSVGDRDEYFACAYTLNGTNQM